MTSFLFRIGTFLLLVLPEIANAVSIPCTGLAGCSTSPENYIPSTLGVINTALATYIVPLGILFVCIAGGYMIISGGSEEKISKGKETLLWAAIGLFVAQNAVNFTGFIASEGGTIATATIGGGDVIYNILDGYFANTSTNPIIGLMDIALLGYCLYCGMKMVVMR